MPKQPNILFVMADQLTPFLTGAYGHPVVQTPNLDRLAREGVCFDAAYSPCPVCAPARAAMLTGRYISRIGAWDNAAAFACEEPTVAHYLTRAGYDTVLAGKMHFVGADQLHGFSRRFNTDVYPADFSWTQARGVDRQIARNHAAQYVGDAIKVGRWSQFLSYDEETHLRALEYLHAKGIEAQDTQGKSVQPFFLCVSYHHPHEPFLPPRELWDSYADAEIALPEFPENLDATYSTLDRWLNFYHGVANAKNLRDPESLRRVRRAYYALVTYIDRKLGELLASLDENGFRDNTIVIFTSDHGDMLCEKGMVQKRTFYEWSSRVPLVMRFPDGSYRGATRAEPVSLIDLFPTLLDLAAVLPESHLPLDGTSLIGLLDGRDKIARRVFSEYHAQGAHAPCFMLRRGKWKYVYIHGYDAQLFDLETDPGEWRNLAGKPEQSKI
ncbi:MAG: choline-sulfatase, partial [Anaerolineales bacterium]|nr:choline-sulfatase [Anaerolineales bacterium]